MFRIILMIHRVLGVNTLSSGAVCVRFSREGMSFQAGQHILVSLPGTYVAREYSIASGEQDPWLEILIRVVPGGKLSPKLARLKPGDQVEISGPCGFFTPDLGSAKRVLVATGTGIAPFRSFFRSGKAAQSVLVHGVRQLVETSWFDDWSTVPYVRCVSREDGGELRGRVTQWIAQNAPRLAECEWWFCGNSQMIQEGWDLLQQVGLDSNQIHTEVYF